MGFIEKELNRISDAIHNPMSTDQYRALYAAQQALAWASDPEGYASPYETVLNGKIQPLTGTQGDSEDCSVALRQPLS